MAAQKGDGVLIKHGNQATPEVFTAVAGIRSASVSFGTEQVDITSADDTSKWRQNLAGAGIMSLSISGSGVWKGDAASLAARSRAMAAAQYLDNWQIVIPGLGTFSGAFQFVGMKWAGDFNKEVTFDATLESAGDITFA